MNIISKLLSASNWKLVVSSIGVLALVAFSSFVLADATKAEVVITANGEKQTVHTHANTVNELLSEEGITPKKHDELSHSLDTQIKDGMAITYNKANKVIVSIDEKEQVYFTTVDTVGEFLKDNNMTLSKRDEVSHKKGEPIKNGLKLSINRAYQVAINNGGKKVKAWTTGGTVKQLLEDKEISLSKLDKVEPALKEKVNEKTSIKIVHVEKVTDTVKKTIDYQTEKREDNNLEKGKKKVIAEGKKGLVVKKFEVVKESGEAVNRELISEKVKQESKNRVVAFGTKEEQNLVTLASESSTNSSDTSNTSDTAAASNESGAEVHSMTVTAYSADCSGCSGITATGINLNANPNAKVVAVDPSVIPIGTKVWVEGYGYAVAADTGGAINGNKIDIHLPTRADALAYGTRHNVKVKVLD